MGAHENAAAFVQRALKQAWQRLIKAPPLEMMEADLGH
jgi:hypothetical protein